MSRCLTLSLTIIYNRVSLEFISIKGELTPMRIKLLVLTLLIFLSLLAGCSSMSTSHKQRIVETAAPISVQYIKKYYNADFIVTSHDIDAPYIHPRLYLYGYIKGHEDEHITIYYDYYTHEVSSVGGPDWFIDSRNPKKDVPSP
jgi:hypothetical protein